MSDLRVIGTPELRSGDPFFSSVSLLMHCDGPTFTDNSPVPCTLSVNPNATISTAHPKFGAGSGLMTSIGGFINTQATTRFQFGSGQFTIEGWGYLTSFSTSSLYILIGNYAAGSNLGWDFGLVNGSLAFYYSTTGADNLNIGAAYTPALNTWVHYAVDRDASNVLRLYANGSVVASASLAATLYASTNPWIVGNDQGNRPMFEFDDVRVTKGVARYAGAFAPPTSAFPNTGVTAAAPLQSAVSLIS